jgi:NarL family two-component system response regulator LiaR
MSIDEKSIRVMIVDEHAVVRSGLSAFLLAFDDLELVAQAASGEEAVALCETVRPDVVLMDLVMPGMDGTEATRHIRKRCPESQVIALTSFKEGNLVQEVLQAGAMSYLLKNVSADELAEAIRATHGGRATLAPEAAHALVQATAHMPEPGHDLTPREREVLALMAEGLNNRQIAARLVVSHSTAKFHVSRILTKLNASSRTEAVAMALHSHLLS